MSADSPTLRRPRRSKNRLMATLFQVTSPSRRTLTATWSRGIQRRSGSL